MRPISEKDGSVAFWYGKGEDGVEIVYRGRFRKSQPCSIALKSCQKDDDRDGIWGDLFDPLCRHALLQYPGQSIE